MSLLFNKEDDNSFAIEPEIGRWHMDDVRDLFPVDYHRESSNIYEITGLHNINRGDAHNVFNFMRELYKDVFPCGQNGYTSGGTHFLFFGDFSDLREKKTKIMYKILNCPLFCKIGGNKLFNRNNYRHSFNGGVIGHNSKGDFICFKSSLSSCHEDIQGGTPIEFRCNNVFDERIYGYYQGIILATRDGVKFKKTSGELRDYCKSGDTIKHNKCSDVSFEEMEGFDLGKKDLIVIRHNTNIILTLLKDNGFVKSAEALKEYLNERGINYLR